MTTHDAQRDADHHGVPIKVRPGLAVSVTLVTVLLAALTLPATVPDHPAFAYFSAGLLGVGTLIAVLLGADLLRARVARRAGINVKSITLGAFGPRLDVARSSRRNNPFDPATPNSFAEAEAARTAGVLFASKDADGVHSVVAPGTTGQRRGGASLDDPSVAARLGRAGLLVTGVAGVLLLALGVLAPSGSSYELLGQVALWVGTFALLITAVEALPTPRTSGGRILAAAVTRRTGDPKRGEAAVARAGVFTGWALVAAGVAVSFLVGLVGLWGVLLGWMVVGSSRLAQAQQKTAAALDGLTVADAMSAPPPSLTAWQTVSEALDQVVASTRANVFVVRDFDGSLAGVAPLRALAEVPMDDRSIARVSRATVPLRSMPTAHPSDSLPEVVVRLAKQPAAGVVLVLDDRPDGSRDVVGVVGPSEITRAVETGPLRRVRTSW